ncbi:MAG: TraR/DksA family transcriptional regulator [Burkholderiales bacterium]
MDIGTQTHLTTLRGLLTYRLHELQADVHAAELAKHPQDARDEVSDRKDEAAQAMLSDVDDAEERLHRIELTEVEHALRRLDAGTYGDCAACGDPIPLQRLLVRPAAERCAECQSAGERRAS